MKAKLQALRAMSFRRQASEFIAGGVALFAAGAASAAGPDYSGLTSAIDFSTTISAILSVLGLMAAVYMVIKGGKIIMGLLRG